MPLDRIELTASIPVRVRGHRLTGAGQACYGALGVAHPTNYPLARLEYPDGRVVYLRTSDHSTLSVGTGDAEQETTVTVPGYAPDGEARLCVVANGLSDCVPVRVRRILQVLIVPELLQLIGSLADGQLGVLGPDGFRPVPPIGPDTYRIIAAYGRIMSGLEELALKGESDPSIVLDALRVPGLDQVLSGLRALRSARQPPPKHPWIK